MPTHEPRCTDDRSPNRNYDDPLVQPEHQLKPRMHLNPDAHHCSCSKCKTGYQKGANGVCAPIKAAAGAVCDKDSVCASGVCRNKACCHLGMRNEPYFNYRDCKSCAPRVTTTTGSSVKAGYCNACRYACSPSRFRMGLFGYVSSAQAGYSRVGVICIYV